MITLDFFKHPQLYFSLSLSFLYCPLFPQLNPPSHISHLSLHIASVLLFLSLELCPTSLSLISLLIFTVTPGYVRTPEDLELGTANEREHTMFIFLDPDNLNQYSIS